MKKYIYILTISTSCVLLSCKKDDASTTVNNNNNNNNDRVKSYTETMITSSNSSTVTCSFSYDTQNRISSINWTTTPAQKFVFSYNTNTEIDMDYLSSTFNYHEIFFLKNLHVDSTFSYSSVHDTTSQKYIYSSSNLLKTLHVYDYSNGKADLSSTTNYYYDANGNMIRSESPYNKVETFEYYPDLITPMPKIFPVPFNLNKNLEKTHTLMIDNSIGDADTTTYTFDENKRISTITQTSNLRTVIIKTFTYY
jgi:hypothetical protein